MARLTLRELLAHKGRLFLTTVSIVLGVGFVAGTFIYTDTINSAFENLFADAFSGLDVSIRAVPDRELGFVAAARVPDSVLEEVRALEGVQEAWGNVVGYAQFVRIDAEGGSEPISSGGVSLGFSWPDTQRELGARILEGRPPAAPGETTMDVATAEDYGFELGDRVQVLFARSTDAFTIVGLTGLGEGGQPGGFTSATFELATAQRVLDAEGELDTIDVVAAPGQDVSDLVARLNRVLPAGVEAVTAQTAAEERATTIKDALGFFNTFLLVFAGIAVFVGAFIIQNTFRIIVAQRTRELGLLRAVGATGAQVRAMVLYEALVVGAVASILGLVVGAGLAVALESALGGLGIAFPEAPLALQPRTILVAVVVGVAITVVSATVPARRAARVPPLAALQTQDVRPTRRSLSRRIAGGAIVTGVGTIALALGLFGPVDEVGVPGIVVVGVGVALFFVGIAVLSPAFARPFTRLLGAPVARLSGVSGALARENSMRSPRRTSATAAALMVGLALVALVAILGASAKATVGEVLAGSLKADFYIQPANQFGPNAGLPTSLADEVAQLADVETVARVRTGQAKVEDTVTFIGAADASIADVVDLELVAGSLDHFEGDVVALSKPFSDSRDLGLDANVSLTFAATGTGSYRTVAIYEEATAGTVIIPLSSFEQNFTEQLDSFVYVRLAPGVEQESARMKIERVTNSYPTAAVLDAAGFQQQAEEQIDQLLSVLLGLLGLAIIIAILGITNTLSLSVIERTREIGLLRAVGMSRSQVKRMVRWEALITSVFGAVLGVAVGMFFGWALVEALREQDIRFAVPAGQLLLIVAVSGVAGVLAAVPPARRAARLDILEAIAYE